MTLCNCDTNGGSCKNRLSQCQTCLSVGQPSFATGTDTCERIRVRPRLQLRRIDYPATAPAPTPQPQSAPAPTPQPQAAPTPQLRHAPAPPPMKARRRHRHGRELSKNKHARTASSARPMARRTSASFVIIPGTSFRAARRATATRTAVAIEVVDFRLARLRYRPGRRCCRNQIW